MGWEVRHNGRRYLYRNRRVNGKPVKEYLAADDHFGFGEVMADDLARLIRREAKVRALERQVLADFRGRIDGLLAAAAAANGDLKAVAEGILFTVGFHKHHRGDWRMKRELKQLRARIDQLKAAALAGPVPLVKYDAPADDAAAVEVFAKARAGDPAAREKVRELIVSRDWVVWVGDLARQATCQLIDRAAGGDPVWAAGLNEKADALRKGLLGENPSVLEDLLARRVVNGWVTTHALELESAVRPPLDPKSRDHLDRALSRAQKRYAEAIRELARVRRLQAPRLLNQLNVVANQAVVNAGGTAATPALPARN
jgi:hypothetical protein